MTRRKIKLTAQAPKSPTYITLVRACDSELGVPSHRALHTEVSDALDSARVNANDTIYIEKAQPETEWESLFTGSLVSSLSFSTPSPAAVEWFAKHGVTF